MPPPRCGYPPKRGRPHRLQLGADGAQRQNGVGSHAPGHQHHQAVVAAYRHQYIIWTPIHGRAAAGNLSGMKPSASTVSVSHQT